MLSLNKICLNYLVFQIFLERSSLVLFQQPLSVTVTTLSAITGVGADTNNRTVVIDLIGELAIQKAPPGYRGV